MMKFFTLIALSAYIAYASAGILDDENQEYGYRATTYAPPKTTYKTNVYVRPTPEYKINEYRPKVKVEYLNAYKRDQINLQEFLERKDEALIPFDESQPHQPIVGTKITDDGRRVEVIDRYDPYVDLETVKLADIGETRPIAKHAKVQNYGNIYF